MARKGVRVRVPPWAPSETKGCQNKTAPVLLGRRGVSGGDRGGGVQSPPQRTLR